MMKSYAARQAEQARAETTHDSVDGGGGGNGVVGENFCRVVSPMTSFDSSGGLTSCE